MKEEYKKILGLGQKRQQENKKFFEFLRKKSPSDLDTSCQVLHEEAFEQVDCLECANCCTTTGPLLLEKDIDRVAKALKMRPAIFAEKYLRTDEDGDRVFTSMPCPFLGQDHYCSIYEDRPNACREYPHTQQRNALQKLKITYKNTLICPAVVLVTEGLKKKYNK